MKFNPLIVSDGGSAEKSMIETLKRKYNFQNVFCRFHIIQNWRDKINILFSGFEKKEEKIQEIFFYLYQMLSSTSSVVFNNSYKEFEKFLLNHQDKPYVKFKKYFDCYYKNDFESWNIQNRGTNYSLLSTNNKMELFIRYLSYLLPGKNRKFKRLDQIFSFLLSNLKPVDNTNFNSTPIGKELSKNFVKSLKILKNKEAVLKIKFKDELFEKKISKINNSVYEFKNQKNQKKYLIKPLIHTCRNFLNKCRCCKHLFLTYLFIMYKKN